MTFRIDALKARDHDDLAGIEIAHDALAVDLADASLRERTVRFDRNLPARITDGVDARVLKRDRQQSHADLLASRGDDVELARIGLARDFLGKPKEAIRFAGHGRRHDDQLVARLPPFRDALGNVLDALHRAHRSAAVFMYDECHCRSELGE